MLLHPRERHIRITEGGKTLACVSCPGQGYHKGFAGPLCPVCRTGIAVIQMHIRHLTPRLNQPGTFTVLQRDITVICYPCDFPQCLGIPSLFPVLTGEAHQVTFRQPDFTPGKYRNIPQAAFKSGKQVVPAFCITQHHHTVCCIRAVNGVILLIYQRHTAIMLCQSCNGFQGFCLCFFPDQHRYRKLLLSGLSGLMQTVMNAGIYGHCIRVCLGDNQRLTPGLCSTPGVIIHNGGYPPVSLRFSLFAGLANFSHR